MKHKIRDSIITLISLLGISAVYRWYMRRKGPLVRVLCFHDVADVEWFKEVMDSLSQNYHVITPEQFHAGEFDQQKINILLTFDDGYESWVTHCLPVLRWHHYVGLFFINSGLLDLADDASKTTQYMRDRLLISPKAPLTWEGAQILVAAGQTIGGHTVTHPKLTALNIDVAAQEITDDKQRTEAVLNITLTDFAYPFGRRTHWNPAIQKQVVKAGFSYVYTTHAAFARGSKTTAVPRVCLEKDQPLRSIRAWIDGGYDIVSRIHS